MVSGDMETMHGSATKYKLHRAPVHVRYVSRKEETRTAHKILVEITLVK
jgi:hypothetical protein